MHIEAIAVASQDGFLADTAGRTSGLHSPEDQALFAEVKSRFPLIVMGAETYLSVKDALKLSPEVLRVVLTHHPDTYAEDIVPNQLEFMDIRPEALIELLQQRGFDSMLVVGGDVVYSEFYQLGLLNKFHITMEPVTIEDGTPLSVLNEITKTATLKEHKILNEKGTVYSLYEF